MKVSDLRDILEKAKGDTEVVVQFDDEEPAVEVVRVERPVVLIVEG